MNKIDDSIKVQFAWTQHPDISVSPTAIRLIESARAIAQYEKEANSNTNSGGPERGPEFHYV